MVEEATGDWVRLETRSTEAMLNPMIGVVVAGLEMVEFRAAAWCDCVQPNWSWTDSCSLMVPAAPQAPEVQREADRVAAFGFRQLRWKETESFERLAGMVAAAVAAEGAWQCTR